jgi:spore germination cell wall hydrolase CwlJ-like protein
MKTFEYISTCFALASIAFIFTIWKPTGVTPQPATPAQMKPLTKSEKQILCNAWEDCKLLAELIVYEARSEPLEGKRLVAKTVLNRVEHKSWPDTIKGVIYEPKQFSYIEDMHKQRTPTDGDWLEASSVAFDVLHGIISVDGDTTFYHAYNTKPYWAAHKQIYKVVGSHVFYRGGI